MREKSNHRAENSRCFSTIKNVIEVFANLKDSVSNGEQRLETLFLSFPIFCRSIRFRYEAYISEPDDIVDMYNKKKSQKDIQHQMKEILRLKGVRKIDITVESGKENYYFITGEIPFPFFYLHPSDFFHMTVKYIECKNQESDFPYKLSFKSRSNLMSSTVAMLNGVAYWEPSDIR